MRRSARLLGIPIDDAGAEEIGRRARGTPRIANRLLRRVRDFAEVRGDGRVTKDVGRVRARPARGRRLGLDAGDRKILSTIIKRFDGGPVGIDSLAASLAEDRDTLEFVYEPYLIQEGFLLRTPRGRQVTRAAYEHLGLPPPVRSRPGRAVRRCSDEPPTSGQLVSPLIARARGSAVEGPSDRGRARRGRRSCAGPRMRTPASRRARR